MEQSTNSESSKSRSNSESKTNESSLPTPPSSPKTTSFVRTKSSATIKQRKSIKIGRLKDSMRRDTFDKILTTSLENLNATIPPPKIEEEEIVHSDEEDDVDTGSATSEKTDDKDSASQESQPNSSRAELTNSTETAQNNSQPSSSINAQQEIPSQGSIDQRTDNNNTTTPQSNTQQEPSSISPQETSATPESNAVAQETSSEVPDSTKAADSTSPPPSPGSVIADPRIKILEELWETESTYVGDLEVVVNMYLIPIRDVLKNRQSIIPHDYIPKIFSNVEQLLVVNTEVLTLLDVLLGKGINPEKIDQVLTDACKIFVKMRDTFKVYAEYCTNSPVATQALNVVSKSPQYIVFEDNTKKSCGSVRLDGFIAKPVQRICKYPLFFKDMLKNTKPTDACYEMVKLAYDTMEGVAAYLNDHKKQKENKEKLMEIEKQLTGFKKKIVSPQRIFYRQSVLMKVSPHKESNLQERMVYLFNDVLIYAKEKGSSYVFRGEIPLHLALVRLPENYVHKNAFQIKLTAAKQRVYAFCCRDEYELKQWITDLRKIIDEQTAKQDPSSKVAKQLILSQWK